MPLTVFLFILVELVFVSYIDLKFKKIANYWSVLNLVIFFALTYILPDHYQISMQTFVYSMAFIGVGFLLFSLKIMGGGDSKFLASYYLLIPVSLQENALIVLLIVTVGVGVSFLFYNTIKNLKLIERVLQHRELNHLKMIYGKKIPYAPVILISWLWFGIESICNDKIL
jgi:prepilin peptidase CpaA